MAHRSFALFTAAPCCVTRAEAPRRPGRNANDAAGELALQAAGGERPLAEDQRAALLDPLRQLVDAAGPDVGRRPPPMRTGLVAARAPMDLDNVGDVVRLAAGIRLLDHEQLAMRRDAVGGIDDRELTR